MSKSLDKLVFERALELLKKGWTRGALARDKKGREVEVDSEEAVRFCTVGAVLRANMDVRGKDFLSDHDIMDAEDNTADLQEKNDGMTKKQVLDRFRRVLAEL